MSLDASTLPLSPALVMAVVGYAALSAFVTGPGIATRELATSNWHTVCQADLVADIEAKRQPARTIAQVPDVGGMICGMYPELGDLCALIPDPNAGARAAAERVRAAEDARLRQAVSGTADQCSCAEAVYVESHRLSLALYAASGRLITPTALSGREGALARALHSAVCTFGREDML